MHEIKCILVIFNPVLQCSNLSLSPAEWSFRIILVFLLSTFAEESAQSLSALVNNECRWKEEELSKSNISCAAILRNVVSTCCPSGEHQLGMSEIS